WRAGLSVAAAVGALGAAPFFLAPYATSTVTRMLVFGLFAASLDLLVGITGLPSLGHAAYFGVGAYAAGWVAVHGTPTAPVPVLASGRLPARPVQARGVRRGRCGRRAGRRAPRRAAAPRHAGRPRLHHLGAGTARGRHRRNRTAVGSMPGRRPRDPRA